MCTRACLWQPYSQSKIDDRVCYNFAKCLKILRKKKIVCPENLRLSTNYSLIKIRNTSLFACALGLCPGERSTFLNIKCGDPKCDMNSSDLNWCLKCSFSILFPFKQVMRQIAVASLVAIFLTLNFTRRCSDAFLLIFANFAIILLSTEYFRYLRDRPPKRKRETL